jgi:8-oxo-dGTP diphosphatase
LSAAAAPAGLPRLRVVAAALRNARGEILIADRPAGRHLAGRWEFPGGKVAAGETDEQALARELREELGITIRRPQHVMTLQHVYPDRQIELALFEVADFAGEPQGHDGQRLKWVAPAALGAEDILEADRPFIEALQRRAARSG